jgi:hypothetical protein
MSNADIQFASSSSSYREKPGCFHRCWSRYENTRDKSCCLLLSSPTSPAANPSASSMVNSTDVGRGLLQQSRMDYANNLLAGLPT